MTCFHLRDSIAPGQPGSTVLAGHTCSFCHGVFDDLGQLKPGDLIQVTGSKTISFQVDRVQHHAHPSPKQVGSWSSPYGPARLVLVTCDQYVGGHHYLSKVVIKAHKVKRTTV